MQLTTLTQRGISGGSQLLRDPLLFDEYSLRYRWAQPYGSGDLSDTNRADRRTGILDQGELTVLVDETCGDRPSKQGEEDDQAEQGQVDLVIRLRGRHMALLCTSCRIRDQLNKVDIKRYQRWSKIVNVDNMLGCRRQGRCTRKS